MPSSTTEEIITSGRQRSTLSGARLYRNYFISTAAKEYEVRAAFYAVVKTGQPLQLHRSVLTHAPQKIIFHTGDMEYSENTGFIREPAGFVFVCIMLLFSLAMMLFYKRMSYPYAHSNACIFISVVTALLFYFHIW